MSRAAARRPGERGMVMPLLLSVMAGIGVYFLHLGSQRVAERTALARAEAETGARYAAEAAVELALTDIGRGRSPRTTRWSGRSPAAGAPEVEANARVARRGDAWIVTATGHAGRRLGSPGATTTATTTIQVVVRRDRAGLNVIEWRELPPPP